MPRFKIQSEGDFVRVNDQVVLESAKTAGQFLHISDDVLPHMHLYEGQREIDASVRKSAFLLHCHRKFAQEKQDAIYGNNLVHIVHKEMDAYMTAEGNFLDFGIGEDVHLRVRKPTASPSLKSPSSNTFWQIEMADDAGCGEPMKWVQLVRFRHVQTRKYLGVSKDRSVGLVDGSDRTASVFRLIPIIKDKPELDNMSYGKIQHRSSGMFLHGDFNAYELNQYKALSNEGMESLRWDNGVLRKVATQNDVKNDDAFVIVCVEPTYEYNVNFVMGTLEELMQFIKRHKDAKIQRLDPMVFQVLYRVLQHLIKFVEGDSGTPERKRQKLLRQLRVVDILVGMLKVLFKPPEGFAFVEGFNKTGIDLEELPNFPKLKKICQTAYDLLAVYLDGDSRKNELYIAKYISFFQSQIGYDMHTPAMFMQLVADNQQILDRISAQQISSFVFWLKKTHDRSFLDFLSLLCVCEESAIPQNQQLVWDYLSAESADLGILAQFQMQGNSISARFKPKDAWLSLDKFSENKTHMQYLASQVRVMSRVCMGRNDRNIGLLSKAIPYDLVIRAIRDETVPYMLRSAFVDFVQNVFVNVKGNRRIFSNPSTTFLWDQLVAQKKVADETMSVSGAKLACYPDLRDFAVKYLSHNHVMSHEEEAQNAFTEQLFHLLSQLVNFGYYSSEDATQLVPLLIKLLDGHTDVPSHNSHLNHDELKQWRATLRITKTRKNKAVVNAKYAGLLLLDILFNQRAVLRTAEFLFNFKSIYNTIGQSVKMSVSKASASLLLNLGSELASITSCVTGAMEAPPVKAYLASLDSRTDFISNDDRVVEVLLDLTLYDYTKMATLGMSLVNRHFSKIQHLFESGQVCQLIVQPDAVSVYKDVASKVPAIRRLLRTKLTTSGEATMVNSFNAFREYCILQEDRTKPHVINQQILFSSGILADVYALLEKPYDIKLEAYSGMAKVYDAAFMFLAAFARRDPKLDTDGIQRMIQLDIFAHLDFFIEREVSVPNMALALAEIFTSNEMCIKLQERQIHSIIQLLAKTKAPELLVLLNAVVRVGDVPIRRNQSLAVKYMMQQRTTTLTLMSDSENEERMRLLVEESQGTLSPEDKHALNYHVRLIRFLASCCEGENPFVESVCQNIFDPAEIFEVLTHPSIAMNNKRPYLRFLLWAYLSTSMGPGKASDIDLNPQMWTFLSMMNSKVQEVSAKDLDHLLDTPEGVQDDYTMREGVFEFVKEFYLNHYSKSGMIDKLCPDHKAITSQIMSSLLAFYDRILQSPLYATKLRVRKLRTALVALDQAGWATEEQQARYDEIVAHKAAGGRKPANFAVQNFLAAYSTQLEIMRSLRKFVSNMESSYRSDKTCPAYDTDPDAMLGGLWRGEEFQQHIAAFVQYRRNREFVAIKPWTLQIVRSLRVSLEAFPFMSDRDKENQIALDVKHLRLLRAIISNEYLKLQDGPFVEEANEVVKATTQQIQAELNDNHVAAVAVELMASKAPVVERAALRLLVMMLIGGNPLVQKSFVEFFRGKQDETFFTIIRDRLQQSASAIKEQRGLIAQAARDKAALEELYGKSMRRSVEMTVSANDSPPLEPLKSTSSFGSALRKSSFAMKEVVTAPAAPPPPPPVEDDDDDQQAALQFKNVVGFVELLLRILQLLCENQNDEIKNYLREQPDHINQYNLVAATLDYLHIIYVNIDHESIDLVRQIFETLNEFSSGNMQNKLQLYDGKIVDVVNAVIRESTFGNASAEDVADLHLKAATVLRTVVEENNRESVRLAMDLSTALDLEAMHTLMISYSESPTTPAEFEEAGFMMYFVFSRLRDIVGHRFGTHWLLEKLSDKEQRVLSHEQQEAYERISFFRNNSASIEILMEGELMRVYFRVRDREALTRPMMEELQWNVDRSSPTGKIESFTEACEGLREHMRYHQRLMTNPVATFLVFNAYIWHLMILTLTLGINILILATWQADPDPTVIMPVVESWYQPVIYALGAAHILISFLVVSAHFMGHPVQSAGDVLRFSNLYHLVFFACSVAGIATSGYFYCFHLLHVIANNDILKRVLRSITQNGLSLLNVLMLAIIVIYIYSVVSFAFLRASFDPSQNIYLWCENMWQCFLTCLTMGLQEPLGLVLEPTDPTWSAVGLRIIFDLSFYIIVAVIGLNIVFGIIVDTFSELRDARYQAEEDMSNACFVCSLRSYDFDRAGVGFDYHCKNEHNQWNYLFFTAHLLQTETTEYTAYEAYVRDLVDRQETSWYPVGRALCLQQDDDKVMDELLSIKSMVQGLVDRFNEADRLEEESATRRRQEQE